MTVGDPKNGNGELRRIGKPFDIPDVLPANPVECIAIR